MTLGRVIPLLIALGFVADLGARFMPPETYTFRAWEGASRYPWSLGAWTPNIRYENHAAHGDLVNLANRPELARIHTEIFTTDRYGCRRNGDAQAAGPVDMLLIGDSFAVGSGVSDWETLAAQLQKATRRSVYNAGSMHLSLWRLNALLDLLQMSRGLVLYECLERSGFLQPGQVLDAHYSAWKALHRGIQKSWDGFWNESPLQILCQRAIRRMQNDRCLPKLKGDADAARRLKNGARELFFPMDMTNYGAPRAIDIGGVPALQDQLQRRGLDLVVVLVPDKYDVYAPLLKDPPPAPQSPYLDELENALNAARVPVINLRGFLSRQAAEELTQGRYLYIQDDSHWNSRGIELSALEIVRQLNRGQRLFSTPPVADSFSRKGTPSRTGKRAWQRGH